eukprot:scaffold709_cov197-Cylindrotheca_fusiformis.AAC.2
MNLCGIGNYAEPELVKLDIPNERFKGVSSSSSRRKSTSKSRSRRKSRSPIDFDTPLNDESSSKQGISSTRGKSSHELSSSKGKPSRGSQTPPPPSTPSFLNPIDPKSLVAKPQKATSVKRLEEGFNLRMITEEDVKSIRLDLDPGNPYLRIRPRYGNENDGSKSNSAETLMRLQDIARLEVGRDKTNRTTVSGKKPIKFFSIMLRSRSKQYRTFSFEAESVADRDVIISGIKKLLEQARAAHKSQKNQKKMKNHHKEDITEQHAKGQSVGKSLPERSSIDHRNDSYGSDFRNQKSTDDSCRDKAVERSLSGQTSYSGSGSSAIKSNGSRSSASRTSASTLSQKSHNSERVKDAAAVVAAKREMLAQGYGCNPFGCSSQALVEDAELAAKLENHTNGPWCADDICSAGLKEFNETVTGIFGDTPVLLASKTKKESSTFASTTAGTSMTSLLWSSPSPTKPKNIRRRPQNRARDPTAKAVRWNRLRFQMTFEGADVDKNIPYLKTIRSCDEYDKRQKPSYEAFQSSPFKSTNPETVEDEDLYYDSDPEDSRERTFKRLGPRGVLAERENRIQDDSIVGRRRATPTMTPLYNRRVKKVDENVILDIIENLKNQKLTLMWHPAQREKQKPPPICVKVWIESGIYLVDGTFLLPKLTWLPVHEGNADSFVVNASIQTPEAVDMLDVCRVRECDTIDRDLYPFASVERSFIVQTQNGTTLFETRTKQDRNHVVNGLKLCIARLASLLMLRDLRAVDEFFGGNSVPGEAPWWAKSDGEEGGADRDRLPTALP